ncbi:hypothetical protein Hypma_015318 [Hypsizygus marmoreus]|uniref:F-box domain-containing protein n=1 Tax=Hypsizygus marmoreus TaxID=39966 RepID=A0A369K1E4_HYPMA|nr:hypothetical protein Hypma_015318 [Hypsizygus marmoreus]
MSSQPRSHFVNDLIPLILEGDEHWWPRDLLRLAQVSSAWLVHARRRLFAVPSVHSFRACSRLARTLSENPALLSLVKGVELRPMVDCTPEDQRLGANAMADLKFILQLEGLEVIVLGGHLAVKAERFLHSLGDPQSVRALHIDGSLLVESLSYRPSLEWDESFVFKLANMNKLCLTNIELDITFPSISYQLQLSELVLDNVTIVSGHISHLVNETPSLERLCIRSQTASDFGEQCQPVLASCAVQTLELEVQTDLPSYSVVFADDLPHLLSLRCLHLTGIQVDVEILTLIGQKCRNLEELSVLGRMVRVLPREWITFMKAGSPSSLRSIGLPWGTYHPPFAQWCCAARDSVFEAAALYDIMHQCPF